jgi:hypothetical protein
MILLHVLRERCNPPPGYRVESIMKSVALLLFSAAAAVRQSQTDARTRIGELGGEILGSMDTVVNALMVSIPDARTAG